MDDGLPIRISGMNRFGLTWDQVSTQEGKMEICFAFGRQMEVREILGLIGKESEDSNPGFWAEEAIRLLWEDGKSGPVSFGSVRRTQGRSYLKRGGIVLEIFNPRQPLSPYDFDEYDREAVTHRIVNDGTLSDLRENVRSIVTPYLASSDTAEW